MKRIGVISTAALSLALAASCPAFAQQEQHDQQEEQKDKPAQEKEKAQPAKQEEKNAQQQDKNNKQEEKSAQQQDRNNQQEEKNAQQQDRNNQQEQRNTQQQHAQPAGHAGGRIPDDRFRANFGQAHRFRVSESDYRDRRFQYGGYWFGFVQPWPSNWLYTQDVYVVEIDGVYYLCNANYPGVNITLSVNM